MEVKGDVGHYLDVLIELEAEFLPVSSFVNAASVHVGLEGRCY